MCHKAANTENAQRTPARASDWEEMLLCEWAPATGTRCTWGFAEKEQKTEIPLFKVTGTRVLTGFVVSCMFEEVHESDGAWERKSISTDRRERGEGVGTQHPSGPCHPGGGGQPGTPAAPGAPARATQAQRRPRPLPGWSPDPQDKLGSPE